MQQHITAIRAQYVAGQSSFGSWPQLATAQAVAAQPVEPVPVFELLPCWQENKGIISAVASILCFKAPLQFHLCHLPSAWLRCACWSSCCCCCCKCDLQACSATSSRCSASSTSRACCAGWAADSSGSTSAGQQAGTCTTSCSLQQSTT